jgi:hypothetical protein
MWDMLRFQTRHQVMSPIFQAFILIPALFVAYSWLSEAGVLVSAILGIMVYAVLWILQLTFTMLYLYSVRRRTLLTNHIIEIADEGLVEESPNNRLLTYWQGIHSVVSGPGFIAVYLTPISAHVIPNRAFSSRNERSAFLAALAAKRAAA